MELRKVVWAEGILLGQQHFQQWDNYYEMLQHRYFKAMTEHAWGLIELKIDETALINSRFKLKLIRAIFPNGQWIEFDANASESLNYDLPKGQATALSIYLAMAENQVVAGITGYQNKTAMPAWQAEYQTVADIYDLERRREMVVAKPKLLLLSDHDAREHFHVLKIAELITAPQGGWQLQSHFIPTVLKLSASPYLVALSENISETIQAKIRILQQLNKKWQQESHLFDQRQVNHLLQLSILARHYPLIKQWRQQQIHPQRLYELLATLLSELDNLLAENELASIPNYSHQDLSQTFLFLEKIAQSILAKINPTAMARLQLNRINDSLYSISAINLSLFNKNQFYVAVNFASQSIEWINQFARQVKVGSVQTLDTIITTALPGVLLTHVQRHPSKLVVRAGYEYFHLEQYGHFWEQIKTEQSLAIFIPDHFKTAELELVLVEE